MKNGDVIKKIWVLLDNFSTYSVTNNLDYVEYMNNFAKEEYLAELTNVGSLIFDSKGFLTFYLLVCM